MSFSNEPGATPSSLLTIQGRQHRQKVPRGQLAELAPRDANDDPVATLMEQSASRVADLIPLRYQRMLESPFAFFRGGALLMAKDLARGVSSEIEVQICGDAHLANFGVYESEEQRLVFDVNDFDETDVGPFEWDVKRLATSQVIAAREIGLSESQQEGVVRESVREYRRAIRHFAKEPLLSVWYSLLDVEDLDFDVYQLIDGSFVHSIREVVRDVTAPSDASRHVVSTENGQPRIATNPPLVVALSDLPEGTDLTAGQTLNEVVRNFATSLSPDRQLLLSQFVPVDAARKVVGVGSVGTRCFVILLVGRDTKETFFLQVKEAVASVVAQTRGSSFVGSNGSRVVRGQKIMQATSDPFLGWHDVDGDGTSRSFYVRREFDRRASVDLTGMDRRHFASYGRVCAWALARAHARSGGTPLIAGYLGAGDRFDEAITSFAFAYARQNEDDYQALRRAAAQGRIIAAS